jgi:mRNA-degrading endonuclease YafQ of YafQ-DinJ toxin-antitoxin module
MYRLQIHKDAQKALSRAPHGTQEKFLRLSNYLIQSGTLGCPFTIAPMKGKYKIYLEAKITGDYRIIFRTEGATIFIRYAGTHNSLGTG